MAHRPQGPFYLQGARGARRSCHFIALVDDHSRSLLGIRAVPTKEALPVLETLAEAIELGGVPLALMTDNGTPFVTIVRTMLSPLPTDARGTIDQAHPDPGRHALDERQGRGLLATLQAEVLDRQYLADLAAAEAGVAAFAGYYDYHRLHGALDWHTPAERFEGTLFTDRGFDHVPALVGVSGLLSDLLAA